MRLAHLADPHLGFRQFHRLTERGRNQREVDVATAFTRAIDGVIAAATRTPSSLPAISFTPSGRPIRRSCTQSREFSVCSARSPAAPVIVIAGNHDTPRSSDTTSIFGLMHEIGLHVAADRAAPNARFRSSTSACSLCRTGPLRVAAARDRAGGERSAPGAASFTAKPRGSSATTAQRASRAARCYDRSGSPRPTGVTWRWVTITCSTRSVRRHWYAGALDYCSTNPWARIARGAQSPAAGKGVAAGRSRYRAVTPQMIEGPRRFRRSALARRHRSRRRANSIA